MYIIHCPSFHAIMPPSKERGEKMKRKTAQTSDGGGDGNCVLYKCICKCFHAINGKMIKKVSK